LKIYIKQGFIALFIVAAGFSISASSQASGRSEQVEAAQLAADIDTFTSREIAAHFGDIKTLDPPPERVFGALTVGDFSWGSFSRALAAQAELGGNRMIAGKDSARAVAEMGLIESRKGGKSFAQLYAGEALRHFGLDLSNNAVWQSMNDSERREWLSLLDPSRFYDPKTRRVINLPDNYLGVAARVSAISFQLGVLKDRAFLDSVVERAAQPFLNGALYADDNPPTGRYDRYSNEYVRFCWDAAEIAGRKDIQEKLRPSLKQQMKLWWDIVIPTGYGYNWGRSQGLVSYLDTLEIVAFLAEHAEFRPASLSELAGAFNQAWRWIRSDYSDTSHMFKVFAFGRGNYSYINPQREWQQTGVGLGKIILAKHLLFRALEREKITAFSVAPMLSDVARFEFFSRSADRQTGIWLVRRGRMHFALPITVGTKPAVSDYLPAPFGLPGFSAPVEEVYPSLVPFLTLADGQVYSASEAADEIVPAADGMSLRTINHKWARVGGTSGARYENGLTSMVDWKLDANRLTRTETLTAGADVDIRTWKFTLPSTASEVRGSENAYLLTGRDGSLSVEFKPPAGTEISLLSTGDSRLGKGVLGSIPVHIVANATNLKLKKGDRLTWSLTLELRD